MTLSLDPSLLSSGMRELDSGALANGTVLAGRFEILRRLGEGGMGVVYAALDRETSSEVALKTLPGKDPRGIARLKQEFRALADVVHENLVGLHELFADEQVWFFTMDLVPGVSFFEYVRQDAQLERNDTLLATADSPPSARISARSPLRRAPARFDADRLRTVLVQLTRGVDAIHAAGKLHRDLKPSNVMVTAEGRVVILDFGLVGELSRARGTRRDGDFSGTPAYMAPEQILGETSPASDWYAVGVMLYEALTGYLPFEGAPARILADKQAFDARPVTEVVDSVPQDLAVLAERMTERRAELRPSAASVLSALGVAHENRTVLPAGPADIEDRGFVGRGSELHALLGTLEEAHAGRPAVALVEGPTGIGKTAIVERFRATLGRGVLVVASRCFEREAMPFKTLDGIVDELAGHLERLAPAERALVVPPHAGVLGGLFPVLARLPEFEAPAPDTQTVQEPLERRRLGFGALRDLLRALARHRPVMVCIDDLQWGDVDGALLLSELLAPGATAGVLFVLAFRSEDVHRSACLTTLLRSERSTWRTTARHVRLAPLSPEDSLRLVRATLSKGDSNPESIAAEAEGNPRLLVELARHASAFTTGAEEPTTLTESIAARAAQLPGGARRLLDVVALSGRPIAVRDALRGAGLPVADRSPAIALVASHLARATMLGGAPALVAYHERVQNAVVDQLDEGPRRALHDAIANALAKSPHASAEMIVDHLAGAGRRAEALGQALAAADVAARALAYETEAALCRRAIAWVDDLADANAVRQRLAAALVHAGRSGEAGRIYLEAALHGTDEARPELRRRAADQLMLAGHLDEGVRILDEALAEYGLHVPPAPPEGGVDPSFMGLMGRLMQRGLDFVPAPEAAIPQARLREIDLLWSTGWGLHMNSYRGRPFLIRHLLAALDAGEPMRVVRGLSLYVQLLSALRIPTADGVLLAIASAIRDSDDPLMHFWLDYATMGHHRYNGRAALACPPGAAAEASLQRLPTVASREFDSLHNSRSNHLINSGAYPEAIRRIPEWLADAEAREDRFATVWMLGHMSQVHLLQDDPVRAHRALTEGIKLWGRPESDDLQHILWRLQSIAVHQYAGETREALAAAVATEIPATLAAVPFFKALALKTLGSARLAGHRHAPHPALELAEVERMATALDGLDMPTEAPFGPVLRAGVRAARGDAAAALAELDAAGALAENPEAIALRDPILIARGHLTAAAGATERAAEAAARLRDVGVRAPDRWARLHVPVVLPDP